MSPACGFPAPSARSVIQENRDEPGPVSTACSNSPSSSQPRGPKRHLTSATKSNGISITMPYWDERVKAMAANYPNVRWDQYHIDILTAHFVLNPDRFDVVVGSNLFGDILSDLGPACTGTIGIAPSATSIRKRKYPSVFEPVHGFRPRHRRPGHRQSDRSDLVGRHDAGASGRDRSRPGDRRGDRESAADKKLRTRDLQGSADTVACGKAIADALG